jgi:hypothetical protein
MAIERIGIGAALIVGVLQGLAALLYGASGVMKA